MISTSEFRTGTRLELEGVPYFIVDFQHVKPGKGGAFVRTKLKNYRTGQVIERTFRSGERFDEPNLDERQMQYLYSTGDSLVFMDQETYDQYTYEKKQLGPNTDLIKEDTVVTILLHEGEPIAMDLPTFMELKVIEAEPGVRGDTATGGTKPAVVETGAVIKVPLYLDSGEVIRIDTRTREYVERVR